MVDICGDRRCIPCQVEQVKPGSGTHAVCEATERRILAGRAPTIRQDPADIVHAWVNAGEHIRVQQAISNEAVRREFGRFIHELLTVCETDQAA